MDYSQPRTHTYRRTRASPALLVVTVSLLALPAHRHDVAQALEFNLRQIADDAQRANRDPVISETGLAAWTEYDTNDLARGITDLAVFRGGERISLSRDRAAEFYGSSKPVAQSNSIAWVANFRRHDAPHSWELQEVAERDEGATEIPALYRAAQDADGRQWFTSLVDSTNTMIISTNGDEVVTNLLDMAGATNATVRRHPSGDSEIILWDGGSDLTRISTDRRHDFSPSVWGRLVAWQKEKGFPFGWEIMLWDDGVTKQLTTNFYYDMAPKVQGRQIAWYGWDGYDFEIYLYDATQDATIQITSNRFDDVSPVLWDGMLAWEGYPAVESDIFIYKDGQVTKISDNVEDDFNPRIWNGQVVWQAFDGDDFEIYLYDGQKPIKVTGNNYDDTNPDIRDGLIVWMGYEGNWDAEVYAWDGVGEPVRLTENEDEDRDPRTAGRRIIWSVEREGKSQVWLAEPK